MFDFKVVYGGCMYLNKRHFKTTATGMQTLTSPAFTYMHFSVVVCSSLLFVSSNDPVEIRLCFRCTKSDVHNGSRILG